MKRTSLVAVLAFLGFVSGHSVAAQQPAAETQKTTGAIIAVEHHWTQAEVHGDVAYINRLLLREYQSVNADGSSHPKSAVLADARGMGSPTRWLASSRRT